MKPGARIEAAIELLSEIEAARAGGGASADRIADAYFRARRYAGSKDRRDILSRVYAIIRSRGVLLWMLNGGKNDESQAVVSARELVLAHLLHEGLDRGAIAALFSGEPHAPTTLSAAENALLEGLALRSGNAPADWAKWNVPAFLVPELREAFGESVETELEALSGRAPLDLRVNALKAKLDEVRAMLERDGITALPTRHAPLCLRVQSRDSVTGTKAYRDGLIEIQDEGSQVAAALVEAKPGSQVVDLCAGAGGKTLALASAMANRGQIHAFDTNSTRLRQLGLRVQRAGVRNVQAACLPEDGRGRVTALAALQRRADRVLIDAPCGGTGTWRRNPEQRWRLNAEEVKRLILVQDRLLREGADLVKPGGRLVYVTCSILGCENEQIVEAFLNKNKEFRAVPYKNVWESALPGAAAGTACRDAMFLTLTPARHETDGFFIAILERTAASPL